MKERTGRPTAASSTGMPIPKEHGAWAVLYAPILTAVLVTGHANLQLLWFLVAVTSLFLAHEPLARLARAGWPWSGVGGRAPGWWAWAGLELVLAGSAGAILWLLYGLSDLPLLAVPVAVLLLLHLHRVGNRNERSVTGEVIGIAGLTITLPGTLYTLTGRWESAAVWLWLFHFIYFTGGIFYVKARVSGFVGRPDAPRWALASNLYHVAAVLLVGLAGASGLFSPWASAAFIPAMARALWGVQQSTPTLNMRRIGYSEVIFTLLFSVLVAVTWGVLSAEY